MCQNVEKGVKTMTDNEIIKALECCKDADCVNCPNWSEEWHSGMCNEFLSTVLDLINDQKAEIEMANCHIHKLVQVTDDLVHECDCAKQEAIKEFAERLKDMHRHNTTSVVSLVTVFDNINNLVKEMVGEDK